jgi:hypothetical protein
MNKVTDKVKGFRRIGIALIAALGVMAPALGFDFGVEDAEKMSGAWDSLITAVSGFVVLALAMWSKFSPDDK